ncbi:hypothetical protein [Actinomadura fibrosa]|uniref:Crocagin biosynthetic protein CgnE/B domain-containing protein n=1 Tax=Actinomadura fibrosa TaxID=111802 RepID=A0ABW2Y1R4_9ACTN|nr:hypothetical protein [Actinomadura fibrosa]
MSDDETLLQAASEYGLAGIPMDEADGLPAGANVVLFLRNHLLSRELRQRFRRAKVLFVPISSFDTDLESALYTLRLTFLTDYTAAVARTRRWIEDLGSQTEPISFVSKGPCSTGEPGTSVVCTLAEDLTLDAWVSPTIGPGQWVGVGSYCEIALTTRPSPDRRVPSRSTAPSRPPVCWPPATRGSTRPATSASGPRTSCGASSTGGRRSC